MLLLMKVWVTVQFAAKVKGGLRGIQFWVCLADGAADTLNYALPDTLDVLAIDCLNCGRISDAKSRFETVYPKWFAKANGRPLVLCWDGWKRDDRGLVALCEPGLFRSIGELARTQGFAGVTWTPELVAEIREIARDWGIDRNPSPQAQATDAPDGWKEFLYDFSQPSQLGDFKVLAGYWVIDDGLICCAPKAGEAGNCALLLNKPLDGELVVEWEQRMSKHPALSLPADNPAVSAGVELTQKPEPAALGYAAVAYADGGWGPRSDHRNRVVVLARCARTGGGWDQSPVSGEVSAGDPIGYDQDQSFRMQLQYPGGQERVTLDGMNWSLESRRAIGLRPRWVWLFCHNCRGEFKNLRIRYKPAGT